MKNKTFDCVEMMRSIREKHRIKYSKAPALRKKRLEEIRKKYGFAPMKELLTSK